MDFVKYYQNEEGTENSIMDAGYINVEKIPDNSDPIGDVDDFKPNSEMQKFYARGSGLDITDNQDLYEVVKMVKDMTDKHLYARDMTWKVDIANRKATFSFISGENEDDVVNEFFLQGVQQYIITEILRKFGPLYKIDSDFLKNKDGRNVMKLVVQKGKE
jgi:hypothetical protein